MTDFGVDPSYVAATDTSQKIVKRSLIVVGVILALNLGIAVFGRWFNPQTDGPFGSSFVTTEHGVGAWHDMLEELGRETDQLRVPAAVAELGPSTAIIVVDPASSRFDLAYADALLRHAESGGRVVLVGVRNLSQRFNQPVDLVAGAEGTARPSSVDPVLTGVEAILTSDSERYSSDGGAAIETLMQDANGAVVIRWKHGLGDVIAVSDPWLFANRSMDQADNAVLAVRITGGGPVVFDEYVHGFGDEGLSGLASRLVTLAAVGLVAAGLAMWAIGKRLGPPQQTSRAFPPARSQYLDAMSRTLAQTRDRSAYRLLRERAQRQLQRVGSRYAGLSSPEQQIKAAAQLNLTTGELAAVTGEGVSRTEMDLVAAAAAKIERNVEANATWTT